MKYIIHVTSYSNCNTLPYSHTSTHTYTLHNTHTHTHCRYYYYNCPSSFAGFVCSILGICGNKTTTNMAPHTAYKTCEALFEPYMERLHPPFLSPVSKHIIHEGRRVLCGEEHTQSRHTVYVGLCRETFHV